MSDNRNTNGIDQPLQLIAVVVLALVIFLFRENEVVLNVVLFFVAPLLLIIAVAYWVWNSGK